jgi:hypothetical protein
MTLLAICCFLLPQFFAQRRSIGLNLLHAPGVVQILASFLGLVETVDKSVAAQSKIMQIIKVADLVQRQSRILGD